MSEPTKAELREQMAAKRANEARLAQELADIDSEARALSRCVKALSKLDKPGTYARDGRSPDTEAIRRVVNAVSERFGLDQLDKQDTTGDIYWEPSTEPDQSFRDQVIAQLIEALRKS